MPRNCDAARRVENVVNTNVIPASRRDEPARRRGQIIRQALWSGAISSVVSSVALAICGRLEGGTAAGPNNGPSQWIWGRSAAYRRNLSMRYTLVGYCVHHATATGWALLHEAIFGRDKARQSTQQRLARGAATAAAACLVDFTLTPLRLRPGFEAQLSRPSLLMVYAAFGLGLASRWSRSPHR